MDTIYKFLNMNSNQNVTRSVNSKENTTGGALEPSNLTQRRKRKSTLGSRGRRESTLFVSEPTLFSIHEETKTLKDSSCNELEEAVLKAEPELTLVQSKAIPIEQLEVENTIDLSPNVVNTTLTNDHENTIVEEKYESILECTLTELSENALGVTRGRPSRLFSPNNNKDGSEDSFIAHETMLVNSDDVVTSEIISGSYSNNDNNSIISKVDSSARDLQSTEKTIRNTKIFRQLEALDSIIQKNSVLIIDYNNQIEELKTKISECTNVNKTLESIKFDLEMTKLEGFYEDNKENDPKCVMENRIGKSSSKEIIDDVRLHFNYLKTPRLTRSSRPSFIPTPHTMSYNIENELQRLTEE